MPTTEKTMKHIKGLGTEKVGRENYSLIRDEHGNRLCEYPRFKKGKDYKQIEGEDMQAIMQMVIEKNRATTKWRGEQIFETQETLHQAFISYLEYVYDANNEGANIIPDVEGACCYIGVSRDTLMRWKRDNYNGFSAEIGNFLNDLATVKKQLALQGKIPPVTFATDFNNNHGYVQKTEMVVTPNANVSQISEKALREKYLKEIEKNDIIEGSYKELK